MKVASAATGLSHPGMKDNLSKSFRGRSISSQYVEALRASSKSIGFHLKIKVTSSGSQVSLTNEGESLLLAYKIRLLMRSAASIVVFQLGSLSVSLCLRG